MSADLAKNFHDRLRNAVSGKYRAGLLILFAAAMQLTHVLLYPFPKRDALTYLHILHYWNNTGALSRVLEEFPKFGLLLFTFLPLKWAEKAGLPLFPASVIWMLLMSLISVYAFYKIILLLTGNGAKALWCGALFAAHPMILYYAGSLLRDTPYLMFSLLHILCFICAVREKRVRYFILSGVTLALCALSRFETWELLVLFPVFAVFYVKKNKFSRKEFLQWVAGAAAGFAGTILLMLAAVDDWQLLFAKGKVIFLSYFPDWMGV